MSAGWSGGSDTRWRKLRASVLRLDLPVHRRPRCAIGFEGVCQDVADCVDHIVPLHMGGAKYDPANCRASCTPCNLKRNERQTRSGLEEEPRPKRVSSW